MTAGDPPGMPADQGGPDLAGLKAAVRAARDARGASYPATCERRSFRCRKDDTVTTTPG